MNKSVWGNIYHNTFTMHKRINWHGADIDYKFETQNTLSNMKISDWFRREAFINYVCDERYIHISERACCRYEALQQGFSDYTSGKFNKLPRSSWESLEALSDEKAKKLVRLAMHCNYVSNANGMFLGWMWPNRPNITITGIQILPYRS